MIANYFEALYLHIKRFFSSSTTLLRFHMLWVFICILLLGAFGGIYFGLVLSEKYKLAKDMEEVNTSLTQKIEKINQLQKQLNDNPDYRNFTDTYLPLDYKSQEYFAELVTAASNSGFSVTKYTTASNESGSIRADVLFGGGTDASQLVRDIEHMRRITYVKGISYYTYNDSFLVKLELEIYGSI